MFVLHGNVLLPCLTVVALRQVRDRSLAVWEEDHEISNDRTRSLVGSVPPEPNLQRVGNQSDSRTFTGPDRPFTQTFSTVTQTFSTVTGTDCTGTYCAQIAA